MEGRVSERWVGGLVSRWMDGWMDGGMDKIGRLSGFCYRKGPWGVWVPGYVCMSVHESLSVRVFISEYQHFCVLVGTPVWSCVHV